MDLQFYTFKYALIKDGVVQEIVLVDSYPTAGNVCRAKGCDEAVCVDRYLVTVGDTYEDGVFVHEGDEIERQKTLEEMIDDLEFIVLQLGGVI